MKEGVSRAVRQLDKSKPPFGFEPFDDSTDRRSRGGLEPRCGKARRASEFAQMRVVAVIVEVTPSGLTKIPISDQVGFLSSRFTAQSRPRDPIVPKNRAARERINLRRQDRLVSTAHHPLCCRLMIAKPGWLRDDNRQNVESSSNEPVKREVRKNHGIGPWNQAI